MSNTFRRYYETLIYVAISILSGVLIYEGYNFTLIGHNQTSATMPFQMSLIHASVMIMGVFLVIYSIVKIVNLVRHEQDYSQNYGGDDEDFLASYIDEVINTYSNNMNIAIECFRDIANNQFPVKNRK